MWKSKFYKALPTIEKEHSTARWIFLTLTVPNPKIADLRVTLSAMNKAWQRLSQRKEFRQVIGWVRTTEVTVGKQGADYCHPHFHVMLLVSPSMFGKNYVPQSRWLELWQKCMRDDSIVSVDVRAVKSGQDEKQRKEVAETFKYVVKDDELAKNPDWFLEFLRQTRKLRFIAAGGELKKVFRKDEEERDYLTDDLLEGEQLQEGSTCYNWKHAERKYKRFPKGDNRSE